jgi:hypothetical protein
VAAVLVAPGMPGCATTAKPVDGDDIARDASMEPVGSSTTNPEEAGPDPDAAPVPTCTGGDARAHDPATGLCYQLYTAGASWTSARDNCITAGGKLLELSDPATTGGKQRFVAQFLTQQARASVWLGASRAQGRRYCKVQLTYGCGAWGEEVKDWLWTSGSAVQTPIWDSGYPENDARLQPRCAELRSAGDGSWRDVTCDQQLPYVCEQPGPG